MVFELKPRSYERGLDRTVGGPGVGYDRRHEDRGANVTMCRHNGRFFRTAIVRAVVREIDNIGRKSAGENFVGARNGMGETDEKISKSKERQERPAKSRRSQSRQYSTDVTFHDVSLANSICEHYYNVRNTGGNFGLWRFSFLNCEGWQRALSMAGEYRWLALVCSTRPSCIMTPLGP